jgi:hypothetical protein
VGSGKRKPKSCGSFGCGQMTRAVLITSRSGSIMLTHCSVFMCESRLTAVLILDSSSLAGFSHCYVSAHRPYL